MNRSLILSNLRIEIRRKEASFSTEKTMMRWIKKFLDEMSVAHSSQLREWHKDLFLSTLQNRPDSTFEEVLQAKSAILFLYEKVLNQNSGFPQPKEDQTIGPGVFRITA